MSFDPEGDNPYVDDSLPIECVPLRPIRRESRGEWLEREILPHEKAIRQMVKHRYPRVDVDEVIQATYLRLMATSEVEHVKSGKHYFYMAAKSEVRDRARRDQNVDFETVDFLTVDVAADEPSVEQVIDSQRALRRFQDAVRELPIRQRLVVELRRIDGLGIRATAETMGLSVSSIEKHQTSAMRRLAAEMEWPGGASIAAKGRLGRPARFPR